jgi:nucleotide-binding universal stress UspA family protein
MDVRCHSQITHPGVTLIIKSEYIVNNQTSQKIMKQLLALTDFTKNSVHAASIALKLCEKLNSGLLLYHSMQYVPVVPDYTYGSYVTETADLLFKESKEKLAEECKSLQSLSDTNLGYQPKVSSLSDEGALADHIKSISARPEISLVVMGARSGGALEHLFSGSETTAVIRNSMKPVLIIPETTHLTGFKKVVFATDFSPADIKAIKFLMELSDPLCFQIEVIHSLRPGYAVSKIEAEMAFREYLDGLAQGKISYKHIFGNHKVQPLQEYCEETGASILAMTRGQHDWISRLFEHSETQEIIAHQHLSVLIFPSGFTEDQALKE